MYPVTGGELIGVDDEFYDLLAALAERCNKNGIDLLSAFKMIDKLSTESLTSDR